MVELFRAILEDDRAAVQDLLTVDPSLVVARATEARFYDEKIFHWLYVVIRPCTWLQPVIVSRS